jgi:hypothetical protein
VDEPGQHQAQNHGHGNIQHRCHTITGTAQVECQKQADGTGSRQNQNDGVPVNEGFSDNKRDPIHILNLHPAQP